MFKFILSSFIFLISLHSFAYNLFEFSNSNSRNNLLNKKIDEINQQNFYKIHIEYPELKNEPHSTQFNQFIKNMINRNTKIFKAYVPGLVDELNKLPSGIQTTTFSITYDASIFNANNHKIISIRFKNEIYSAGAAHPGTGIEVVNYDLTVNHPIRLNQLFKTNANYLQFITNESRKQLIKKIKNNDAEWFDKGTNAQKENYKNWNVLKDGILFTFDEYQVASYSFGMPETFISYKKLKPFLSPHSPFYV